jgi:type IV secretory pathway VirB4 component
VTLLGLSRAGQPGHRSTTAHFQAAYPFVAEGGLGGRGVYIGRDVYGGSFCYDPWELYGRELTSPNAVVVGIVGRAKSSLVKTYVWRQSVFGRQAWVVDVKGEYDRLCQAMGVVPIALAPGGSVRLNPLTPRAGAERQLNLLHGVAAASLERPLTPEEKRAAQAALEVVQRNGAGEPTLPAIVAALLHPTGEMSDGMAMHVADVAVASRPMAFALDQLCSGSLRGMFDGPTSPGLDLDAPLVVLNLRAVLNSHRTALGILMTCATAWLQATIEAERDEDARKRIVVVDEAWRIFSNLGVGEWLQQSFKLSRGLGTQNIVVMHRLSDLRAAGAEGSREVRLAEGLLADAETKVIYAQPPDQIDQARQLLGLTDTEAELLPALRRGWALWKVGQRSFLVQHRLSPFEHDLVDTDARMAVGVGRRAR